MSSEGIHFTKMHGAGNDYIYIDCHKGMPECPEELAAEMSDRHKGVGADGLVLILPSDIADLRMRMFNADGSEGRMCGNASRCIAKYAHDHGLTDKSEITLETLSGIKSLHLHLSDGGEVESVTVDMGEPTLKCDEIRATAEGEVFINQPVETSVGELRLTAVGMGNPHGVVFIDCDPDDFDVRKVGRELEHHSMWPDRANIEFVKVISPTHIKMRVWERGSGETMACGTGACAAIVAANKLGLTTADVEVSLPGGLLDISISSSTGHVMLTGDAVTVMEGHYFRTH